MSYTNVTRGQGSFVSRTAKRDVQHPGGTTTFVKRVTGEIFEPTGSNVSTAFMLVSGSTEMHKEALMSASLVLHYCFINASLVLNYCSISA